MAAGASADTAAQVVTGLAARGWVDDAAFARRWVEARARRGLGAGRLRAELAARGVPEPCITAALAALDEEAALAQVRALARRRVRALGRLEPGRVAARLAAALARRGWSVEVARRVVQEILGTAPDPPRPEC